MMRLLTYGCLALVIGVTSVQLAVARGHTPVAGTIVICTGSGPVHVLVDKNGAPTDGLVICPDLALTLLAHVEMAAAGPGRTDAWFALWLGQARKVSQFNVVPDHHARGPPASV
jgi:hypothetical protein